MQPVRLKLLCVCSLWRYLFVAGSPARIAAIAWVDGQVLYTDCEPPVAIVGRWVERQDQQIMGLELLSIALALSTFERYCKKRKVCGMAPAYILGVLVCLACL